MDYYMYSDMCIRLQTTTLCQCANQSVNNVNLSFLSISRQILELEGMFPVYRITKIRRYFSYNSIVIQRLIRDIIYEKNRKS